MSKGVVVRLFVGACLTAVAGLVLGVVAVAAALANGAIAIGGPQVVTVDWQALGGMLLWLVVAALVVGAGALAALISWIGALLNTAQLEDKTWFIALLLLGLISLGWIAMVAYVVAGPDGIQGADDAHGVEPTPRSQGLA